MERCRKPWSFESKRTKPTVIVQHLIQSMGASILKHQIPWKYELDITCQKGQPAARGKSHGASDLKCAAWGKPDHQSPEQLKMSFQMHSGSHLATRAQNSSKSASKGHLRATWPPEPRTALLVLALVAQWLPSWPQASTFCFFNLPKGAASSQRTDCGKHDRASDIKCDPAGNKNNNKYIHM